MKQSSSSIYGRSESLTNSSQIWSVKIGKASKLGMKNLKICWERMFISRYLQWDRNPRNIQLAILSCRSYLVSEWLEVLIKLYITFSVIFVLKWILKFFPGLVKILSWVALFLEVTFNILLSPWRFAV